MAGTRWHKITRDVFTRKARTVMVATSIFIGVSGVVTLTSVGDLIVGRLRATHDPANMSMLDAGLELDDGIDPASVDDQAVLDTLRDVSGVTAVQAYATERLYWRTPDDPAFIESFVRAYTAPLDALPLEPLQLIEGRFPAPGVRELAVERRMADRYGLSAGDTVVVRVLRDLSLIAQAGEIPEETWTISGIIFQPNRIGNTITRMAFVNFEDLTHLSGQRHINAVETRFTTYAQAERLADAYERTVNAGTPYEVTWRDLEDPDHSQVVQEAHDWTTTLSALAAIAMLVSTFLVVTVIVTLVIEQRRQIGVMKSLGATRLDNVAMYTGIAVVYGVIGTLPGVLLGIPAGYFLTQRIAGLVNIWIPSFTISATGVAVGAIMGVAMPLLAAVIPVVLGTRVTILEAITDLGLGSGYGRGPASRLIRRLPLPLFTRQALANVWQRRGRLALTGLTLTLAAGAFMGVSGLFISLNEIVDRIFETYNYELAVIPVTPARYDYDAVGALLAEHVDGLKGVYPAYDLGVDMVMPNGTREFLWVSGFDPRGDSVQLHLLEGRGWTGDPDREGIVITQGVADRTGKGVGDTLTLVYEDQEMALAIIGIDRFPFDTGFTRWDTIAALGGSGTPDEYWLRFEDDPGGAEVDRRAGQIRETLLHNGIVPSFENQRAHEEDQANTVLTVGIVFNIASLVMAAVGAIGLLAMLFISVFERQREIGIMRSVGAGSATIAAQFLVEGLVVGLIAWLVGLPLSYGVLRALEQVLPLEGFAFTYPPVAPVLGLIGMLGIATLASLWPSLAAARKTVSDILRYQ